MNQPVPQSAVARFLKAAIRTERHEITATLLSFLFGLVLIIWCMHVGKSRGWDPGGRRVGAEELLASFRACVPALLFPVVILGGIFGGVFTPTEAAAVAVFYALLIGRFVYRELAWANVPRILRDSFVTSATVIPE